MTSWPALAPFGKKLTLPGGELFYYDSAGNDDSAGSDDSKGNDDSAGSDDSKGNDDSEKNNKPVLVLIHGLADEADTWRHLFPVLAAAGYRVIAPDLPGFGRSLWKGRISMNVHTQAVIRLMAASGAASGAKPAVFAGSSLGAGIAELAASQRPAMVRGLILIDGCYPFDIRGSMKGFLMLALPFAGKGWYRNFRTNHEGAWKSLYPYYHDLNAMSETDRDFLRRRVIDRVESDNQERGYFATIRSMNFFMLMGKRSAAAKLTKLPVKIQLIWGEHDHVFPLKKTAMFRGLRPDAALALIPGAGHLPHQEKPEAVAAEILRFAQML